MVETHLNYCYLSCQYVSYLCLVIVIKVFLFSQLFITFLFSLIIVCAFSHLLLSLLHPFLFALPSVFLYSYLLSCIFIFYVLLSLCFYKLCSDFIMSNGLNPSVPIEVLSYVRSCAAFCLRFFCLKLTISRDIHFFFWFTSVFGTEKKGKQTLMNIRVLSLFCFSCFLLLARGRKEVFDLHWNGRQLYFIGQHPRKWRWAAGACGWDGGFKGTQAPPV